MNTAHILLVDQDQDQDQDQDLEAGAGLVPVELPWDTAPCCALFGDASLGRSGRHRNRCQGADVLRRQQSAYSAGRRTPSRYQGGCASARCAGRRRPALGRDRYPLPHRWPRHRSGTAPRPGKCLVTDPTPGIDPLTPTANLADDPTPGPLSAPRPYPTQTHGLTTMSEQQLIHVTAPQGRLHQLRYKTARTDRGSGKRSGTADSLIGMSPAPGTEERS